MSRTLASALILLGLAGCAHQWPDPRAIDPVRPRIYITADNHLVVDQDPIIVPRTGERRVTWQLPRDSKARFNKESGLTIDTLDKLLLPDGTASKDTSRVTSINADLRKRASSRVSLFPCKPESDYEYACTIPTDLPRGLYAYTIRVMIDGKPFELDPRMMP